MSRSKSRIPKNAPQLQAFFSFDQYGILSILQIRGIHFRRVVWS
jgi:hypothetical protein